MNQTPSTALVLVGKSMLIRVAAISAAFLMVFAPVAQVFAQENVAASPIAADTVVAPDAAQGKAVDNPELPPAPKDDTLDLPKTDTPVSVPEEKGGVIAGSSALPAVNTDPSGDPSAARVLPDSNDESLTPIGKNTRLSPDVDNLSGALTYTYSLDLPPGRNGMTPDLALSYNSSRSENDSVVGYGWSLSIPSIERINRTGTGSLYSQDDYFSSSLSGELVNMGSGVYSPKVENGDFLKYEYDSTMWTVTDKTGTVYKFGTNATERQDDNPSSPTVTYKWMLEEVRDTNNNSISYTYAKSDNQLYPATITYAGIFEIDFTLQARDDVAVLSNPAFPVTTDSLIETITVKVDSVTRKTYDLVYAAGNNTNRSLLSTVTETGYDVSAVAATPRTTTFTYQEPSTDFTSTNDYQAPVYFSNYNYNDDGARLVDVNGDGFADIIESQFDVMASFNQAVYINDGHGTWTQDTNWSVPMPFTIASPSPRDAGVRIADVNGDGLPDLLFAGYDSSSTQTEEVWIGNGIDGWDLDTNWSFPVDTVRGSSQDVLFIDSSSYRGDNGVRIADVNGDGLADLVRSAQAYGSPYYISEYAVYLNNGDNTGWTKDASWEFPTNYINPDTTEQKVYFAGYGMRDDEGTRLADVNGDGLADLIQSGYVNSSEENIVYLNTGKGWTESTVWELPTGSQDGTSQVMKFVATNATDNGLRIADLNGDKLPDLIYSELIWNASHDYGVYINNGETGWDYDADWDIDEAFIDGYGGPHDLGTLIEDVNGDGMADVVRSHDKAGGAVKETYLNDSKEADLLTSITFPEGGSSTVTYKKSPNYFDGTTGDILNLHLPLPLTTVASITLDDNNGVSGTSTYSYEGGTYYYIDPLHRKVAGFHVVTKTDDAGNITKTYFHQGNDDDTASGEDYGSNPNDSESKIGKVYRVEKYDSSNSNPYEVIVTKWGEGQISSSDSYFVHKDSTTTLTYEGDSSDRDRAEDFTYNDTNGNLLTHTEWGEVTAAADGSFTDTGTDDRATYYDYAVPVGSTNVIGLPSHETVNDTSGSPIKETNYYYDSQSLGDVDLGNLTLVEKNTDGSTWNTYQKAYNSFGLVETEWDPRSNPTGYSYDSYNLYPAVITDALSWNVTRTYDYATGKVIEMEDKNLNIWTTTYDGLGRPLTEVIPMSSGQVTKTEYTYDDNSSPNSIQKTDYINSSLSRSTFTYLDGFGRAIQIRSEAESDYNVTDTIYNALGQIASQSLPYSDSGSAYDTPNAPGGIVTSYTYDPLGRVLKISTAPGDTNYVYDDWQITVSDANTHDKTYYMDAYENLIQVDEHNDTSTYDTHYEWNLLGKLTKITDAENNERAFTYDWLGNRLSAEDLHVNGDNDYGIWNYVYDLSGNMIQSTDPRGMQIDYQYDELNRILYENDPNLTGLEVEYVYDTACTNGYDHLCSATGLNGVITEYSYFPEGTVETEAVTVPSTQYLTAYTYDYQGNVESIVYPNSDSVAYTYNVAGLLESIDHTPNGSGASSIISDIDYAPHGAILEETYGNGITTTNTYDSTELYRLSHKVTTDSSTNLYQDISYTYDNVGNITQVIDASNSNSQKTANYLYDELNRLIEADISGTPSSGATDYSDIYTYTGIGNFEAFDGISYAYGGATSGFANPHAATLVGTDNYTYDEAGNLLDDSNNTYSWTYRNELAQATTPGGTIDYLYDHTGKRVQTNDTTIVIDTPNKYYETNGASPTDYIYAGAQLVANVDGNGTHYIHGDHLTGSNVITDSFPKLEELLDYYPYGDIRLNEQTTSLDLKKKFTGHEYDTATDLNYMGARYYQAKRGQFLSEDPIFLGLGSDDKMLQEILMDPQSMNSYAYARNNPMKYVDPDGKWFFLPFLIEAAPAIYSAMFLADVAVTVDVIGTQLNPNISAEIKQAQIESVGGPYGSIRTSLPNLSGLAAETQTASKAATLTANKTAGAAFEVQTAKTLQDSLKGMVDQLTLKTGSGIKVRMDLVGRDSTGSICLIECKSSSTAPLTKNQSLAFPEIQQNGATVVGQGKGDFLGGTFIPPTQVNVIRP